MTLNLKNSREKELRVNNRIRTEEVRLVYDDGTQEVLPIKVALDKARDSNLDLVEISPNVNPPICKLLDYGKYKFQREKKQKESKKKQKIIKLKEVRMQPKINAHDLNFKVKHIIEFLTDGNKVKVTIRFRGRELAHTQIGHDILNNVLTSLDGSYILESAPKMEGKFMYMIVAPKK